MTFNSSSTNARTLNYAAPGAARGTESIGQTAARGMVWMGLQTISNKILNLVAQVVLAWLLAPSDFGLVTMAYTVSTLANILQQTGQREILVQRQHRFARWASAGFWMSLSAAVLASVTMLAAAPLAAWFYGEWKLIGLVAVLAISPPLTALSVVPMARLQADLRFRTLALLWLITFIAYAVMSIVLAAMHFGAYSFVIPFSAMALLRAVIFWVAAPVRISRNPQLRHWRYLLGSSAMVFAGRACATLIGQAAYIVLGLMCTAAVVGIYYFAFSLSMQILVLLAFNLDGVLFPVLSKLQGEPMRQREGFLSATRLLAMVGMPACLLEAALAEAAIQAFFQPKWYPAIPILQVLCVGMGFRMILYPSQSLVQAQGRFRIYMIMNLAGSALLLAMLFAAAPLAGPLAVAIASTIYFALEGPITMHVALGRGGRHAAAAWRTYGAPIVVGVLACGPAVLAARLVPASMSHAQWVRMAVIIAVSAMIYFPAFRWIQPQTWNDMLGRLRLRRARPAAVAAAVG